MNNSNNAQEVEYSEKTINEILDRAEKELSNFLEEEREELLQDIKQILINENDVTYLSVKEKEDALKYVKRFEKRGISVADLFIEHYFEDLRNNKETPQKVSWRIRRAKIASYYNPIERQARALALHYLKKLTPQFTQDRIENLSKPSPEMRHEAEMLKKKLDNLKNKFPGMDKEYISPRQISEVYMDCDFILSEGRVTGVHMGHEIMKLRGH